MIDKKEKFGRNQFILMFFAFSFGMVLSNLITQNKPDRVVNESAPLFIYKGEDKTLDDLSVSLQEKVMRLDKEKRHLLELAAIELHVHQYAHDHQISLLEAEKQLLPIESVSEEQVSRFYNENKERLGRPFYEVKDSIEQGFKNSAIENSKQALLEGLKASGNLAFSLN